MKLLIIFLMWIGGSAWFLPAGRIWRTALRTGRWLLADGRSHYFPSKSHTFSLYDRANNPCMFKLAVAFYPTFLAIWLLVSLFLAIGFMRSLT
jgi:hypothetical protein